MIRRPPRSTHCISSAASDVYKRQVHYMHMRWTFHRDLKTSNLLVDRKGDLKVCDFGLARRFADPLRPYTHMVVTLWYRAPELLLGSKVYTTGIDMWSVGCIFAELLMREPLFMGKNEQDQIDKIFKLVGYPPEMFVEKWPMLRVVMKNFPTAKKASKNKIREKFPRVALPGDPFLSDQGVDLLRQLLALDPETRIAAVQALEHPWFKEEPLEEPLRAFHITESDKEANKQKRKKSLDEEQIKQREAMHEGEQRYGTVLNKDYRMAQS
eukprot:TRINITY_DN8386_c0_g2_i3.p1 TRINITY_DN8386_c0_g2~~TRINITY_DN8386_c0_g2_i3.p1  ORF type:complete len:276 (-),score=93.84 TRINITY_DN8386_c0_g2_i3:203-1006(-)